jgi:hypothetical protein
VVCCLACNFCGLGVLIVVGRGVARLDDLSASVELLLLLPTTKGWWGLGDVDFECLQYM